PSAREAGHGGNWLGRRRRLRSGWAPAGVGVERDRHNTFVAADTGLEGHTGRPEPGSPTSAGAVVRVVTAGTAAAAEQAASAAAPTVGIAFAANASGPELAGLTRAVTGATGSARALGAALARIGPVDARRPVAARET